MFRAVILFVVEDITYNVFDQRALEFRIREFSPETKVIRRNLTDLITQARLGPNRQLFV